MRNVSCFSVSGCLNLLGNVFLKIMCNTVYNTIYSHRGGSTRPNQGVWGQKSPSGVEGRSPGRGSVGRSPPEAGAFLKVHSLIFKAITGENERHNLMPLMAFFIAVHTRIVLFQCHVAQCLASMPPPPKSALVFSVKLNFKIEKHFLSYLLTTPQCNYLVKISTRNRLLKIEINK